MVPTSTASNAGRAADRRDRVRHLAAVAGGLLAVVLTGAVAACSPKSLTLPPGPSPTPVQLGSNPNAATASSSPSADNGSLPLSATRQDITADSPRCHTNDLSARFAGGQGFTGHGAQNLVLTNTTNHVCHLYGNPGMQLMDAQGRPLPTTVQWFGTRTLVTLQPGHSGYADVITGVLPGPSENGAPCDPPAAGVLITPPDESTQLTIIGTWRVCGHGHIQVGPLMVTPPEPLPALSN